MTVVTVADCPVTFFGGPSDGATIVRPISRRYRVYYPCNSYCTPGVSHSHPEVATYVSVAWYEHEDVPISILAMIDSVEDYDYPV